MKNISQIHTVGIDLAKNVIQIFAADREGQRVMNRRFSRNKAMKFFESLPPCMIGMEACSSSHHWARSLIRMGHQVRMMPAQYVKPFVKTQKNDFVDAEAIVEAMLRPNMRFVEVKSEEQQSVLLAHRLREQLIKQRTQTINAIRGHCAEFGLVCPKGAWKVVELEEIIEDEEDARLSKPARELLLVMVEHLRMIRREMKQIEDKIKVFLDENEACQRLAEIPGIGIMTATALVATVGDARQFRSGRHLAAFLGLVPRQHSTGGKTKLLGISKRGDSYLRKLLIHGARSLCSARVLESDKCPVKLKRLVVEKHKPINVAAVAMANRNVRIAWALMFYQDAYDKNYVPLRKTALT